MSKITKAVFPVAGLGTRFLPATKASPKEMLPIVDKPLIQYAVEEAVAAGITEMIFVTSRAKRAIEDHFDRDHELEDLLDANGKHDLLQLVHDIVPDNVSCIYIRQAEALGLGHAVLCAQPAVGNNPFAVLLADDLITMDNGGCTKQLLDVFDYYGSSVIGVEEIDPSETDKYGIVNTTVVSEQLDQVDNIVEKPKPSTATSNLAVVGRYVLTPRVFHYLEQTGQGAGSEIQLTDAIASLMEEEALYSWRFSGTRYDCGNKLGFLKATVEYAMQHDELRDEFGKYLNDYHT